MVFIGLPGAFPGRRREGADEAALGHVRDAGEFIEVDLLAELHCRQIARTARFWVYYD